MNGSSSYAAGRTTDPLTTEKGANPFGDATPGGFRLTFKVANPHTVAFRGFAATLTLAPDENGSSGRTVPLSVTADLLPGDWNQLDVAVNPASARELREISVGELSVTAAAEVGSAPLLSQLKRL
jgi:hypothetical protein